MNKKIVKKWLTKKEFNRIKKLLEIGISMSDISKVINRSHPLVSRVSRAKDWGEYVTNKREYAAGKRKEKQERASETMVLLKGVDVTQEFVAIREALANIERAIQ